LFIPHQNLLDVLMKSFRKKALNIEFILEKVVTQTRKSVFLLYLNKQKECFPLAIPILLTLISSRMGRCVWANIYSSEISDISMLLHR